MTYLNRFSEVSHQYSKDIKTDDTLNPFSYMLISSGTLFEVFFEVVMNAESDDTDKDPMTFAARKKFEKNLNTLKKEEVRKIYKLMLYEYFSFAKHFMNPMFIENFPVPFAEFEKDFQSIFVTNKKDLDTYQQIDEKYDSAYHSRLLLKLMKFPAEQDDLFVVETLEELKKIYFHRFNDTITNYLRIRLRGGDELAKKLRKL